MRKIIIMFIILTSVITSCKRNDYAELKPVLLAVNISLDPTLAGIDFPIKSTTVKLTNLTNGNILTGKTDENGKLTLPNISPGNYDIEALLTISSADYLAATGTVSEVDVVFNSVLKSQNFIKQTNDISLVLKTGKVGDWVIKQVYYAGSNTSNGASFRDTFIEIYNNSNQTLYADSLYFSQVYGSNTKTTAVDLTKGYYQTTSKQFDWTKSIGMNNAKANSDYLYAKTLFMIEGSGKQYPVQPGTSIIIASTAINHKAPFVGADGKTTTVKDPSLTIDLSKADFEVYLGNYPGITPLASDIDNPAIPNLKVLARSTGKDLLFDATGRDSYVVFKSPVNVSTFSKYPSPDEVSVGTTTELYIQIPNKYISDGVEIETPLDANRVPKKLSSSIDAGGVFVSKGQYSSQSIIRKTAKTVNGRRILADSNNSKNDFTELDIPDVTKTIFK